MIVIATNELERRYVAAALRAFARRGYFGTTMNHIAEEAGVSQPRISQVFDGKLSAYLAANEVALDAVIAAFEQCPPAETFDPAAVGQGFVTLLRSDPDKIRLVLHSVSAGTGDPAIGAAARQSLGILSEMLVNRYHATPDQARDFLARGLFSIILIAAGLPTEEATPALRAMARVTPGVDPA